MDFHSVHMDFVGCLWLVVLCSWLIRPSAADSMGRKILTDLKGVISILLEMGCWETIVCVSPTLAIFTILAISMARSKNSGKGKATSSSMERAVKKMEGRYFAGCKESKREAERFIIRERGSK